MVERESLGRLGTIILRPANKFSSSLFLADIADADLVRHEPQSHVGGLVERFQHVDALIPVHNSDRAVTVQHHSLFFGTIQN